MCGIAGYFGSRPLGGAAAEAMFAAIARRGPDANHAVCWRDGQRSSEPAGAQRALMHARLSIRDPRPEADQPVTRNPSAASARPTAAPSSPIPSTTTDRSAASGGTVSLRQMPSCA